MNLKVIYLDNPPVNALSSKLRLYLLNEIKEAENNDNVHGIILKGRNNLFSGGADINEFKNGSYSNYPNLVDLVQLLARCPKPTIALTEGATLGGGVELAIGCQFRVAMETSQFALPEINLGILPAAGATQLLPRLIGLDCAMTSCTSGKFYSASEALAAGAIDAIVTSHEDAMTVCQNLCSSGRKKSCLLDLPVKGAENKEEIFSKQMKRAKRKWRGAEAPLVCLDVIKSSASCSFQQGLDLERETFLQLCSSDQSKALRYVFFSERSLKKWKTHDGISASFGSPQKITKVAVIGLGTMGSTITICFLRLNLPVYIMEADEGKLEEGFQRILHLIDEMKSSGVITDSQKDSMTSQLIKSSQFHQLKDVDLVVEAIIESLEAKKEVFRHLDASCKPSTIFATNTSFLDIDQIASVTHRPSKVIGMHFFAPAHRMKLLENVRGAMTSPQTLLTAMWVGFQMRKATILVGNCSGFVVNRMYVHFLTESEFLVEEGASPQQIDGVLRKFGFPMGRFEVTDVAGNDVGYRVREAQGLLRSQQAPGSDERLRDGMRYSPMTEMIVESGRLGYKSGLRGWFKYSAPFAPPEVDPEVMKMIEDFRKKFGIKSRVIEDQEILMRMLYPMINEGFKILDESVSSSPLDIDLAWISGMGWPRFTGGPMYYAHVIGLPVVLKAIQERWNLSKGLEAHWKPSVMLVGLVHNHGNPDIHLWVQLNKQSSRSKI